MGVEDGVMEEALEPEEEEEDLEKILAAMPQVSLDIFDVVKSSRAQHGLRHDQRRMVCGGPTGAATGADTSATGAATGAFSRARAE